MRYYIKTNEHAVVGKYVLDDKVKADNGLVEVDETTFNKIDPMFEWSFDGDLAKVKPSDLAHQLERSWRNSELNRADIELYKVQDSDPKAKGSVSAWREYRKSLRQWPEHQDFPDNSKRPIAPDA